MTRTAGIVFITQYAISKMKHGDSELTYIEFRSEPMSRALGKVKEDLQPGTGGTDAWILDRSMRYCLYDPEIFTGRK